MATRKRKRTELESERDSTESNDDLVPLVESEDNQNNDDLIDSEPPKKKQKIVNDDYDDYDDYYDDYDYQKEWDTLNGIDSKLFDRTNYIYKLQRNRTIGSDEAGQIKLYFDIYVCNKLKVDESKVNKLKKDLFELADNNNDWRNGEPIQNIIDPDLFIYKYFDKESWSKQMRQKFDKNWPKHEAFLDDDESQKDKESEWNQLIENEKKGYFLRSRYQWIATEFTENKENNSISIRSGIHNISPRQQYEDIYKGIEHIFECMLPLFNQYKAFKNRLNDSFQVIVKAQRYCIDDGRGYKGFWHKEGLTENIIIAGLYYLEKDENLEGGNLKFRNIFSYHDDNQSYLRYDDDEGWDYSASDYIISPTVDINEGRAVVFDNERLVHRVKMLKNKVGDNKKRYRSFLAFFIVDPLKETDISTKKYWTLKREDYAKIVIENGCNQCPMDLAMKICEYGGCGMTLKEAKKMREKDIEIRKNTETKGKWGAMHFGNSGSYKTFYKNGKANPYQHEQWIDEWVQTTNSEF